MKKLIYVAAFLAASMAAYAQGTITFNNRVTGTVDAPVFDVGGTVKLDGANGYFAQVYAGPDAGSLAAVGSPVAFRVGSAAGYISGGDVSIASVAGGAKAQVQLRAWGGGFASYEAAVAGGAKFGSSSIFESLPLGGAGAPPSTPPAMVGLTSFSLVPEPSTIALGALGMAALLIRRRK